MKQKDFPGLGIFIKIINPRIDREGHLNSFGDTMKINDLRINYLIHLTVNISVIKKNNVFAFTS